MLQTLSAASITRSAFTPWNGPKGHLACNCILIWHNFCGTRATQLASHILTEAQGDHRLRSDVVGRLAEPSLWGLHGASALF